MTALEEIKRLEQSESASNQELLLALAHALNSKSSRQVMAALEEMKKLAETANQELLLSLAKELGRKIFAFRDTLLDNINRSEAFYGYAFGATREMKSMKVATEIWEITWHFFANSVKRWEEVNFPKVPGLSEVPELSEVQDIAGIVDHLRNVVRELAAKAEKEYRSYKETAFLLGSPENAKRLKEALDQANKGEVMRYSSVAEFIKSSRGKVQD